MRFQLGDTICADGELYQVIGRITYKNADDGCKWDEYRLIAEKDGSEHWLSVDDVYKEYSIWQMLRVPDRSGYHWSDHGTEVVVFCDGDVDVERGDRAEFTEYEDATEELKSGVTARSIPRAIIWMSMNSGMFAAIPLPVLPPTPKRQEAHWCW